jgi:thiopurine S-methyltransferase
MEWASNQIGFHEAEANPLLLRHLPALHLALGARVFVPLCGKTRDIHWLRAAGYQVAGSELSPLAIGQLFAELGLEPRISTVGTMQRFKADGLSIHVGNIFDLDRDALGAVDAIYDRAALVALPDPMRARYATHLMAMTATAKQLLVCLEYDQSRMAGPPFSVGEAEIRRRYDASYRIARLESREVEGGLKGAPARETIWLLEPR